MKYKIGIRKITEDDIRADCPFMPEADEFDMYFSAFLEDIQNISVVISAEEENGAIIVELDSDQDFAIFREEFKGVHQHFFQQLRTTAITKTA